jgi:hypothetical protein
MATKLRRKSPFHCRAAKAPGSKKLCLAVLTEADGDECASCAAALAAAKAKFRSAPVRPATVSEPRLPDAKPHWPFWPGTTPGNPCSPEAR